MGREYIVDATRTFHSTVNDISFSDDGHKVVFSEVSGLCTGKLDLGILVTK